MHVFSFHNKSNEITSLWPVFIIFNIHRDVYRFVVSSRRNKTNPHHRNKFIPVLNATHLQAFKPKLSTYDQVLKTDQQDVSLYMCVRKLKHFQPHSLLCHLWCFLFAIRSFFLAIFYIWSLQKLTKQLRKIFFFLSYTIFFTMLNNCIQHICTSRTIASSQYHPRETRPLLSQPNLYKKSYIGLAYYEFVSYITRNESICLQTRCHLVSYYFFLSFLPSYIIYMKLCYSLCRIDVT